MARTKSEIITFKADASLSDAMKTIPNRSEFIRAAVLSALDNLCPLCSGTGILSPNQKKHWSSFTDGHALRECDVCHEPTLICDNRPKKNPARGCH